MSAIAQKEQAVKNAADRSQSVFDEQIQTKKDPQRERLEKFAEYRRALKMACTTEDENLAKRMLEECKELMDEEMTFWELKKKSDQLDSTSVIFPRINAMDKTYELIRRRRPEPCESGDQIESFMDDMKWVMSRSKSAN